MGLSMADRRAGALVWVQRKNGSWWPGRVVGPSELLPSRLINHRAGTPVKLLGREDASVDWYNLEKSKRIKAFRCGEFNDCIERVESSHANFPKKIVKYAHREDAILQALKLEKQLVQKQRKAPGVQQAGNICQAKRSRCIYMPVESNNCRKRTAFHPKLLQVTSSTYEMNESPMQSGSAKDIISSRSMGPDSSQSDSQVQREAQLSVKHDGQTGDMNGKGNHVPKDLSDFPPYYHLTAADFGAQKMVLKGKENIYNPSKRQGKVTDVKSCIKFKNGIRDNGELLTSSAALNGQSRTEFDTKAGGNSVWIGNNTPSQSATRSSYLEDPSSQCLEQVGNGTQTTFEDVELTVQASYRGEHVPLVSLMSGLNGKAIVGHPVDVEASDDGYSEILLTKNRECGHGLFGNEGSAMLQLTWRTSRRTPVCYVPQPHPHSTMTDDENALPYQRPGDSSLKANSLPPAREFRRKPVKKPSSSNQKTKALSSFDTEQKHNCNENDLQPVSQGGVIDGLLKAKDNLPSRVYCVPIKLIFSKLLFAVGSVQS